MVSAMQAQALLRFALVAALAVMAVAAQAGTGLTVLPGREGDGPVTVFYPSSSADAPVQRGPFHLRLAENGAPQQGNGRLVVLSHGSGGAPWPQAGLAQRLVAAGYVVALPEHRGDNHKDMATPGPVSWKLRPLEVSRAIDAVAADARFASLLALDKVGMWGMSAGGHTALSLAGGRWSPAKLLAHCEAHLDEDFATCVGLSTQLTGGWADGLKKTVSRSILRYKLDDAQWYGHTDPRIAAIVAEVPFAVDFDPATLAQPRVPLGIVQAGQDRWLLPRFHSGPVLQACKGCELVADLPTAGHGSLLSPQPPGLSGLAAQLLSDPPGFDRALVGPAQDRIVAFMGRHLLP